MPACPGSDPILLSCAKKNGVGRQEEVAQRKPFERVFSGLFRKQKGCGPFEIPGVPDLKRLLMGQSSTCFGGTLFLACKHLLVCKMTDDYAAKQQIWRHLSAARHFCSAKILAGRAAMGDGALIAEGEAPRAKKFPEEICFAPSRVCQVCRTPDYRVLKSTQYAQLVQPSVPGSPGCQRGRAPLFPKESRGNHSQGFPLGNFFAAARHRASLRS